jgi:arachidonate 15-lipoxygenase
LTQVIFTASVQHATVNFPQRTIMSYTPAMPLAAYAPFPAPQGSPPTQLLDILPPLQMGLLQQAVGTALGGVHHTVLGQYGGELATVQVGDALPAFQRALQNIELDIQRKTALGERTPYTTLLPSLIPQSINI